PVLRATWWISKLPATQVTPRRLSSGLVAAMRSAIMSSIPVSTSRISGRASDCGERAASMGRLWYAPAAGLADLAGERPAERLGHVARRDEKRVEVDAVREPLAVEEVDEVLGGQVARGARRVRAAAGPA